MVKNKEEVLDVLPSSHRPQTENSSSPDSLKHHTASCLMPRYILQQSSQSFPAWNSGYGILPTYEWQEQPLSYGSGEGGEGSSPFMHGVAFESLPSICTPSTDTSGS